MCPANHISKTRIMFIISLTDHNFSQLCGITMQRWSHNSWNPLSVQRSSNKILRMLINMTYCANNVYLAMSRSNIPVCCSIFIVFPPRPDSSQQWLTWMLHQIIIYVKYYCWVFRHKFSRAGRFKESSMMLYSSYWFLVPTVAIRIQRIMFISSGLKVMNRLGILKACCSVYRYLIVCKVIQYTPHITLLCKMHILYAGHDWNNMKK